MSKPKSSASLAFRLNARLFFRQLLTFALLDFLLCGLFLSVNLYLTDNRALDIAARVSGDPMAAGELPWVSGYQADYQRELPQGYPLFERLDKLWASWSEDPDARRYLHFDYGALDISAWLESMNYMLIIPVAELPEELWAAYGAGLTDGAVSQSAPDLVGQDTADPLSAAGAGRNPAENGGAGSPGEAAGTGAGSDGVPLGEESPGGYLVVTAYVGEGLRLFWTCLLLVFAWQGLSLLFFLLRNIRYISVTLRPLRELTATTQVLSASGKLSPSALKNLTGALDSITASHLDARIPLNRVSNELKPLAEAINEMLERIDEAYRSQMRFVSDASHELRTPIAVIQGYANLLTRWGTEDPETLKESVQAIKAEADAMKEMVEQLLFLARGDNDSMHLVWEELDLAEIGEEVLREVRMIDSGHQFVPSIEGPAKVKGDAGLMKQLMRILVDNSVKYTPEGGRIYLGVQRASDEKRPGGREVLLKVQDEGVGIPAEALSHIFDRFYRADESRARNTGGTGLGLSIAQWIIERHGGYAEVISREGLGTRFVIHLPAEGEAPKASALPEKKAPAPAADPTAPEK